MCEEKQKVNYVCIITIASVDAQCLTLKRFCYLLIANYWELWTEL